MSHFLSVLDLEALREDLTSEILIVSNQSVKLLNYILGILLGIIERGQ